jgi:hypothetical protein
VASCFSFLYVKAGWRTMRGLAGEESESTARRYLSLCAFGHADERDGVLRVPGDDNIKDRSWR